MLYSLTADALLVLHLLFILFVVLGGLLVMKWRWLVFLHLPAAAWGTLVEFNSWLCPLTPWEVSFRHMASEQGYETGFIEHYLAPLIYPAGLTSNTQVILGSLVIVVNVIIYSWLLVKIRKQRR